MKKLLLLIICFICINQGIITFAESETVNKPSEATMTIGAPQGVKLKLKDVKVKAEVGHYVYANITVDELRGEYGVPLSYDDLSELQINGKKVDLRTTILADKKAKYYVRVGYKPLFGGMVYSNEAKIEVVESDLTTAKLRDNEIYVGEPWDIENTFDRVTDKYGRKLTKEDVEFFEVNGNQYDKFPKIVDTTKAGKYKLAIVIRNGNDELITSNRVMLTVLDYTSLKLKDDELYEGEKWDLGRVFEKVTDKYGNPIKPEEVEWVWIDGQE
ncbi:bacterial Ig-like domain-containing protein, partial [Enterococcus faecalis]|uniref:bacterial Ig-like domain-containing protein n=1 Tax=Enterococcus faecalis TaxID=1351 RepID=UPI0001F0D1C5